MQSRPEFHARPSPRNSHPPPACAALAKSKPAACRRSPDRGQQIGQILAPVQGRHGHAGDRPEKRKMELVDMEMQDVELVGALPHRSSMNM